MREPIREVIEPRYGFIIPYLVRGNVLYIPRVYQARRRPLDYDSLEIPSTEVSATEQGTE
ncbi:hypothetical protein GCM10007874_49560 [Labrys miyagiensis]|uniref:Uncharacterized protein n=1 Tax=Labrys miyagiensis TaxID=346912 RepID=A0ABQ6CP59_9HYPH|nr:hypothetical protein [Labrys miyagiensis]GLS21939.1 hypothetical protein GCM10007874_49560 [Labrys miyagiensis]